MGDTEVSLGGDIDYIIIVENIGNTIGTNFRVRDILGSGIRLIDGSVKINSVFIDTTDVSKIVIGEIESGEIKRVTFNLGLEIFKVFDRTSNLLRKNWKLYLKGKKYRCKCYR
ncbi:MAG: hypothetical protein ACRDDY_18985 [Clostridium sp.]|uniref:hypothetical protein n=1 Tax=Clostridium sp. TaxID=1506 RepID=UPI003EE66A1E